MHRLNFWFVFNKIIIIGLISVSTNGIAGVIVDKTRVVIYDNEQAKNLSLANMNAFPVITQLWVDNGGIDVTPENAEAPVMVVPAMIKFSPGEHKIIKLINLSEVINKNQEEMYWLNIYEIPPKPNNDTFSSDGQLLVLTIKTQIKVFLRPIILKAEQDKRFDKQSFSIGNNGLTIKNDSPFFIVYSKVSLSDGFHEVELYPETLPPFTNKTIDISSKGKVLNLKNVIVKFDYVDDNGIIKTQYAKKG